MERKSNIELLRIMSMLSIIGVHYLGASNATANISEGQYNIAYIILETVLGVGVNIFVLITGYFMIDKSEISIRKIFKLLFDIVFYGISIYMIAVLAGIQKFSMINVIKAIVPILFGYRWFVKAWIVCYVLIPFINKSLNVISKESFKTLLIIMFILFSIWPFFIPNPPLDDYGYSFWHFIYIYMISAYIKRFSVNISEKNCIMILVFSWICTMFISLFGSSDILILGNMYAHKWALNSPFMIIASLGLFMIFQKIEIRKFNKKINMLAASAFAVFLIHGDYNIMEYLFVHICKAQKMYATFIWIPYMFVCIVVIYVICFFIDIIKIKSIDVVMNYIFDKIKICNYRIKA